MVDTPFLSRHRSAHFCRAGKMPAPHENGTIFCKPQIDADQLNAQLCLISSRLVFLGYPLRSTAPMIATKKRPVPMAARAKAVAGAGLVNWRLRLRWGRGREFACLHLGLESYALVAAVTEGLVLRVATAAQTDCGPASEPELPAILITDHKVALDSHGTVVLNSDFGQGVLHRRRSENRLTLEYAS